MSTEAEDQPVSVIPAAQPATQPVLCEGVEGTERADEPMEHEHKDGDEHEEDSFLEEMFENFASDPEDEECEFAYWSDGIGIRRSRMNGVWTYWTVPA